MARAEESSRPGRAVKRPPTKTGAPEALKGKAKPVAKAAAAGARKPAKVNVFVSYARNDHQIAKALHEELIDINRDRVECFLDTETIESGEGWEKKLEWALARADWLVCIYTGEQSEFCGYEIGVFTKGKALEKATATSRLVCLYDAPEFPGVFRRHQNRFVGFPPEYLPPGQTFDETDFYQNSELAKFFENFCSYRNLYVPRDPPGFRRQAEMLVSKAKRITDAFRA